MPPEISTPAPTFVDMLEPYVRALAALFEYFFPTLQRILAEGLAEFIMVTAIISMAVYVVKYAKDQYRYYRKMDDKIVSFSVNYIENGVMKLRPVAEEISIEDLFKQLVRQNAFIKAVRNTPTNKTVVLVPRKFESSIMGTIQSYVSKDFGDNFFTAAAGRRLQVEDYVMMITYERYEDVPLRKVRVIFTHRKLFESLPPYHNSGLRFEKPHQQKRLLTLAEIHETYYTMEEEQRLNFHLELPLECPEEEASNDNTPTPLRSHRANKHPLVIASTPKIRHEA